MDPLSGLAPDSKQEILNRSTVQVLSHSPAIYNICEATGTARGFAAFPQPEWWLLSVSPIISNLYGTHAAPQ